MPIYIKYYPHGTTFDNEAGIATGTADTDLSPLGQEQIKHLGEHEKNELFDAIFCSDLVRAKKTAEAVSNGKYTVTIDQRLREINVGDLTQKRDVDEVNPFKKSYITKPFPNGESYNDIENKMHSFLNDLKRDYPNKRIAIIGHQATQLALEVILCNKTWEEALDSDWRLTKTWQPGWEYTLI